MKDLEKLKIEQVELKEKLLQLIDFMNGEEFAGLDGTEKGLLASQRAGMEVYLNALTQRIYGANDARVETMLPILMMSMLGSPFGASSQKIPPLPESLVSQQAKECDSQPLQTS